ncbi:hypothetical protein TNCV_2709751 [Trichonephila clavipes]|nr:hypothetical protein TNCV_2709751 [Trichonephila clavipes]
MFGRPRLPVGLTPVQIFWPTRPLGTCCKVPRVVSRRKINLLPPHRTDSQKAQAVHAVLKRLISRRNLLNLIEDLHVSGRLFSDRPNPFPRPLLCERTASANQIAGKWCDCSFGGTAKAFRRKAAPISALNGPTDTSRVPGRLQWWSTILKPGKDPTLAEIHRPISLLPILSKLAEKNHFHQTK